MLGGSACLGSFDILPAFWQLPLDCCVRGVYHGDAGENFTPLRVPHGVLNATTHFEASMELELLVGLIFRICFVEVYNIFGVDV